METGEADLKNEAQTNADAELGRLLDTQPDQEPIPAAPEVRPLFEIEAEDRRHAQLAELKRKAIIEVVVFFILCAVAVFGFWFWVHHL